MGPHLDTQPAGGRYDGILGVHAALELLRILQDNNIATEYPVAVINWTNEEGASLPKVRLLPLGWTDVVRSLADLVCGRGRSLSNMPGN